MLKNLLLISYLIVFLFTCSFSQIPNAGFENWTNGEPDGWISSNIPTFLTTVSQSTESYSGSSAVKLVFGDYLNVPYYGYLVAGDVRLNKAGFAVSKRYGTVHGYYKLDSSPNKILEIQILFTKGGNIVGTGFEILSGNVPNYTDFTVQVGYGTTEIPDSALLYISYIDTAQIWTAGGGAYVDDLSFGEFVDIKEVLTDQVPITYKLVQNYPNPFNPTTTIGLGIPENGNIKLSILNILGEEIRVLLNEEKGAGYHSVEFNASDLPSGVYFYRIQAGSFIDTKKMLLLK